MGVLAHFGLKYLRLENRKLLKLALFYDFSTINTINKFHRLLKCKLLSPKCANTPISSTASFFSQTY